jgi:sugar phosphate isomerase/epimerase
MRQLQLRGLNVPASMLSGWTVHDLDRLRDRADKAGCPCLVLIEDTPLPFASPSAQLREDAVKRVARLAQAAHRLGCNALAVQCDSPDEDEALELTVSQIKKMMRSVERLELNLLIAPNVGLTAAPDRLAEVIKRIGGFRIGSLPDFSHAAEAGDLIEVLRKLAPYAGAIHATVLGFDKKGKHREYDLAEAVRAIRNVGFVNTIAIDYIGAEDPVPCIERARDVLQEAISDEEQ